MIAKIAEAAYVISYVYIVLYALGALVLYVGRRWPRAPHYFHCRVCGPDTLVEVGYAINGRRQDWCKGCGYLIEMVEAKPAQRKRIIGDVNPRAMTPKPSAPPPAQRRMPDFDGFGHAIPCHPTEHKPEIKIGSREWCGVCGYEVRS